MKLWAGLCTAVAVALFSGAASAAIVVDQVSSGGIGGGLNPPVIQSFTPATNNIAGVEVFVGGTAAFENDLTINVYESFVGSVLSGLIATGTDDNVPRGTVGRVDFPPVEVTPEQVYYLQYVLSNSGDEAGGFNALLTIGVTGNPYSRGSILDSGGNEVGADTVFTTFTDDEFVVPEPASAALLALAGSALIARRRG